MKKNIFAIIIASISIIACKTPTKKQDPHHFKTSIMDENSSKNSLDWEGTYKGTIPCADCNGIETKITIRKDSTYNKQIKYLGKIDNVIVKNGTYKWNEQGSSVIIDSVSYMIGKNTLIQLNIQKEIIDGSLATKYVLSKVVTNKKITDIKWELIELQGQKVKSKTTKIPFFTLKTTTNNITGNAGCNNFFGGYTLKVGNRIQFSKIATTQMFCKNAPYERPLLKMFETVDNYIVKNDTLYLHKAKMAPLMKFIAITQ